MRHLPGWVVGAAGVGVVVAAFFLGGRLAAEDLAPQATALSAAAETAAAAGVQIDCEPGQRAVLRQPTGGAASLACVTVRSARANYSPAMAPVSTMAPRSVVRAASTSRSAVSRPRSTKKSVAIIAGSTAAGALIGGLTKGKKAAVIGGLIGGGAATIWDQVTRRRADQDR